MDKKKIIIIVAAVVAVIAVVFGILAAGGIITGGNEKTSSIVDKVDNDKKDKGEKVEKDDVKKEENKEEKKSEEKKDEKTESSSVASTDYNPVQEKVKPTFMYFVSKKDPNYDAAMQAVESLKKSYGDSVVFDIRDVDEEPDVKKNFALVDGQTPALIMLNTENNISTFEFKCSDESKLRADIENALK